MPELPDVEQFRRFIEATALDQTVSTISVLDDRILENTDEVILNERLQGNSFSTTERVGKNLFLIADSKTHLVLHFGMTGFPVYRGRQDQEPKHLRMRIDFSNGNYLGFINQRLFGRVSITDSIAEYLRQNTIGTDALSLDFDAFNTALSGSKSAVKTALMNQKHIAGIGNIYADEILFQAGISPKKKAVELTEEEKHLLFDHLHSVLRTAIDRDADSASFPSTFVIPHRKVGNNCPVCSTPLKKINISGRGTFFCPSCQR